MEINEREKSIHDLQRHFFGQRYTKASISSARLATEDAARISGWLKGKQAMLVLMGNPGCGKTHLCSAIIDWMFGKVRDIYAIDENKFFERIRASMDMKGDYHEAIAYQADHEFLIFDDLGSAGVEGKPWRIEVIFSFIDIRQKKNWPTIFTTNLKPSEIKEKFGSRIYSRLMAKENCVIDMFGYPDYRLQSIQEECDKAHKEGLKSKETQKTMTTGDLVKLLEKNEEK